MNQFIIQPPINNVSSSSSPLTVHNSGQSSPITQSAVQRIFNLPDTIKHLEHKIKSFGPGPHNPTQTVELNKLMVYLQKARIDLQKQQLMNNVLPTPTTTTTTEGTSTTTMSTTNTSAPSTPKAVSTQGGTAGGSEGRVLDKRRLQELVKEVDPMEQLEEDVEEVLLQIADDFIEGVVTNSCHLARHRKSNTLDVKDVKLHLERSWNMVLPGYGTDDVRTYKKACPTEAHKQRMSLIRKTLKKY